MLAYYDQRISVIDILAFYSYVILLHSLTNNSQEIAVHKSPKKIMNK